MPERDYVGEPRSVTFKGAVDFDELYDTLKKWFRRYKYDLVEMDYKEFKDEGQNKLLIRWEASRKVNDYVKYVVEIRVSMEDYEEVTMGKKKGLKGSLKVQFAAYLLKDYEETWHRTSWIKFIREVFDKYGKGSQLAVMEKELREEVGKAIYEVKKYLNIRRT